MDRKCSGAMCPMQHGKINVHECNITETCQWFTPEIAYCSFCKTFPAIQEKNGRPCCSFCKTQLDMAEQFSQLHDEIYSGFKRLEEEISGRR